MATAAEEESSTKRSLIVDEAAFEEQFLRCHICNEKFNQEERHPKSLPCNHTFCLPCLKQVFDHNAQNQRRSVAWLDDTYEGVLKCPECRVEIFLSRSEISALPSDHRVIQMMDFLSQVAAKSQNVCTKHENQSLNFFCKKCLVPVCRDCTVLDHKEQQGHNIVDVTDALSDSNTDFDAIEQKSKVLLDKMKGRTDSLANASKQLDLLERQLKTSIKDTFIEYRLLLERRQEALIGILKDSVKEQKQNINSRFVDICTQGSQLQKMYDCFKNARSCNDIRSLFTIQQEMKEKETEFTCTAEANDDELFITCKFNNPNECIFLSEMSGLGEVISEPDLELKNPVPAHQLILLDSLDRQQTYLQNMYNEAEAQEDDEQPQEETTAPTVTRPTSSSRMATPSRSRVPRPSSTSTLERLTRRNLQSSLRTPVDVDEYVQPLNAEMEREAREAIASSYLMRIASRLNESAAEMAEVLGETDTSSSPETSPSRDRPSQSAGSEHGSRSSSSRSGRSSSGNVRVVRHPQAPSSNRDHGSTNRDHGSSSNSSYSSSSSSSSRYNNENR